jgi:STIP1 homology and U-box containing protein 1
MLSSRVTVANEAYSIQQDSSNAKLFSNRALTRIKLQDWQGAEQDSRTAIRIYGEQKRENESMKSYYYLAQALLNLRKPAEALERAKYAYSICLQIHDSSSEVLSQFILKTKQAHWQSKESARLRELNETLGAVEDLLDQQLEKELADVEWKFAKQEIGETGRDEEKASLKREAEDRRRVIRDAFSDPARAETAERVGRFLPFANRISVLIV